MNIRLKHIPAKLRGPDAMCCGYHVSAVDQGRSTSEVNPVLAAPVFQIDQPRVVVDQVGAGFNTAFETWK